MNKLRLNFTGLTVYQQAGILSMVRNDTGHSVSSPQKKNSLFKLSKKGKTLK